MRSAARIALALVGLGQLWVGVWAEAAPRSFFVNFPGLGHHWLVHLGSYSEHLVRDYGASEVGLGVLLLAATLWFERRVVLVAGGAFLFAAVPHFAYHLTTTDRLPTSDNTASLGSFVVEIVLVALAMLTVSTTTPRRTDASFTTS